MYVSGHDVPEEIIACIVAELARLPPEKRSNSRDMVSVYNDLRSVRLVCKTFARTAAVHLFRSVPFSTEPADWVRITAISKHPLLAQCVRRVVYRTWIHHARHSMIKSYSHDLLSNYDHSAGITNWEPLELGSPLLTEETVRRGFERYMRSYKQQQRLLKQTSIDTDAADLNILVQAFRRFPNLKEFSVNNPEFPASQIEAWRGPAYLGRTGPHDTTPSWIIRDYSGGDLDAAILLPLHEATRKYFAGRFIHGPLDGGLFTADLPNHIDGAWDLFALAKFRGLQLFGLAAELAHIKARSLKLRFGEGVPVELQFSSRRKEVPPISLLRCEPALESITKLDFEIVCTLEQDAQFLKSGFLGKAMDAAPRLQDIRVRNRYNLSLNGPFTMDRQSQLPQDGWRLPLSSIFGTSTFQDLRRLEIDGIFSTKTDLLEFLCRHRKTLKSLSIAGISDFDDEVEDLDERVPGRGNWSLCTDILTSIGMLDLSLTHLVVLPSLQSNKLLGLANSVSGENGRLRKIQAIHGPRRINGVQEIKNFLASPDV